MGAALRKCPQLVIAPPDFSLYQQYSEAFLAICRRYAPALEQFSIDECFLDMTGTRATYPDPIALAYEIKNVIRDTLGFTVNVGIARNKLLAKMASDFEKPDRVHTLFPDELERKLWPLPVGQLLTVGKTTANKLQKAGIATIGELAQQPIARLQAMLGKKWGMQLHAYANGIDHSPVIDVPQKAKGYSISTTVEDNVSSAEQANHILLTLADSVSARMRADGAKTACIAVSIRSNDFRNRSHQCKLHQPVDTNGNYLNCQKFASVQAASAGGHYTGHLRNRKTAVLSSVGSAHAAAAAGHFLDGCDVGRERTAFFVCRPKA